MRTDKDLPILPGGNAALPPGTLPGPYLGPQSDENRDPPPNTPAPVKPTQTVPPTKPLP